MKKRREDQTVLNINGNKSIRERCEERMLAAPVEMVNRTDEALAMMSYSPELTWELRAIDNFMSRFMAIVVIIAPGLLLMGWAYSVNFLMLSLASSVVITVTAYFQPKRFLPSFRHPDLWSLLPKLEKKIAPCLAAILGNGGSFYLTEGDRSTQQRA